MFRKGWLVGLLGYLINPGGSLAGWQFALVSWLAAWVSPLRVSDKRLVALIWPAVGLELLQIVDWLHVTCFGACSLRRIGAMRNVIGGRIRIYHTPPPHPALVNLW